MDFFLGTHEISWLEKVEHPLFISIRRIRRQKKRPRAICEYVIDSSGYTQLSMVGAWVGTEKSYADEVIDVVGDIGPVRWAAPRDWMCENNVLDRTGRTVSYHQQATINSFLELRAYAPQIPWAPILQGQTVEDYLRHIDNYEAEGVNLRAEPIVGVGSVCRRQGTHEGAAIMRAVSREGIAVHAFGIKTQGLALFGGRIASADSMAWSYVARKRNIRLPGCKHKTCGNCRTFALQWRAELLASLGDRIEPMRQQELPW